MILNLSIWFALHVLFGNVSQEKWGFVTVWRPDLGSIEWLALSLFAISSFLAFRLHWGIIKVLGVSSILGLVLRLAL